MKDTIEKIPFPLLLGLFLLYLGFQYYQFAYQPDSVLGMKKVQVEQQKKVIEQLRDKVNRAKEFYATLDVKKTELRSVNQQLESMKASLSNEIDIPGFIKMAVTEASRVGLRVASIKPAELKVGELYAEQAFEMKFTGVYLQLLVFLDRLASLERIIRVDNFDVVRTSSAAATYVEVAGSIQLKAYRYVSSSADAKPKAGGP
jgi:Tfp pilus assembly protein PilO